MVNLEGRQKHLRVAEKTLQNDYNELAKEKHLRVAEKTVLQVIQAMYSEKHLRVAEKTVKLNIIINQIVKKISYNLLY